MTKFKQGSPQLLLLLAVLVALGPLSTDMYLPALPSMVTAFDSSISQVQLTLGVYLAGFSLFHLVCGPLSDRYGRKPVLVCGLVVFVTACIGCAMATSVEQLIGWRFIQGVGACVGPTLGRAMVRDIYGPVKAARAFANLATIMALAPVVAPIIGGWIIAVWHWPVIFIALGCYSLVTFFLVLAKVPETMPVAQSIHPATVISNYIALIRNTHFRQHVLAASFLYAGAFAFIAGSSFVLIDFMGVAPQDFGYWFMFIVIGYMLGNIFTGRYAQRFSAGKIMLGGAFLGVLASSIMILLCLFEVYHPLAIVMPIALYTCAVGITLPQAMAVALAPFAEMAGTASALMGFCQMAVASASAAIVGLFLIGNPLPLALTLAGCAAISLLFFYRVKDSA